MRRGIYIFVVIALLIGLLGLVGCSLSGGAPKNNPSDAESFSTVVRMNGKELTVGAPIIATCLSERYYSGGDVYDVIVTGVVKNTGHEPIILAELELAHTGLDGSELPEWWENSGCRSPTVVVKDLSVGQVQTLRWMVLGYGVEGGLKIKVKRLE